MSTTAISKPIRVQRKRSRGWRMPPNTVCVDRTTQFYGNPFIVGTYYYHDTPTSTKQCFVRDRKHAAEIYDKWLHETYEGGVIKQLVKLELRGKNLACFCPEGEPCHADILLKVANEE